MDCRLDLKIAQRNGRSYIKDVYTTPPLRVIPVGQLQTDGAVYAMLASSSPGILSGDVYEMTISLDAKSRLQLKSQSYQRVFDMAEDAYQHLRINMQAGSTFSFVPHPLVPHYQARLKSTNRIDMDDNCDVLLSEIITCGRKHYGECFEFTYLHTITDIYHHGSLLFKDNVLLQPDSMPLKGIGYLENYTHQGSLVYLTTKAVNLNNVIEHINQQLKTDSHGRFIFGISALSDRGFIVRLLGHHGEELFQQFEVIQTIIWNKSKLLEVMYIRDNAEK